MQPVINTIGIDPKYLDLEKLENLKIIIVRQRKGEGMIIEDIYLDNGKTKRGIRYFLDGESLSPWGSCPIGMANEEGDDMVIPENNSENEEIENSKVMPLEEYRESKLEK